MSSIKLLEDIIESFIGGDMQNVVSLLNKEYEISRNRKSVVVSKRINNLLKKISYQNVDIVAKTNLIKLNDNNLVSEISSDFNLDDIILDENLKPVVCSFINEWKNKEKLIKKGLFPSNKILLYGYPGTGKTKLAKIISNSLDMPLVIVKLDELISSYLGKTGQNIKEIFDIAKDNNVVLFFDEIDTIAKYRDDRRELGELKRIVTVLLQNIDFFPNNSVIIGATNHEKLLDKAIWRRFNLKLQLELPNIASRKALFKLFIIKNGFKSNFSLDLVSRITKGLSGSEIEDISKKTIRNAILNSKSLIKEKDLIISFFDLNKDLSSKKKIYKICNELYKNGYEKKEISRISKIPYTTILDNLIE